MQGNLKSGMQCAEFDLLLADALDGSLNGDQMLRFENHKTVCASCAALFAETQAGFDLLSTLDEVEPPRNLVHNIIAATSGIAEESADAAETPAMPVMTRWQRAWLSLQPVFAPVFTPRFGGSLAMAFFSITLVLNVAGIKVSELGKVDFSMRGLERTYYANRTRAFKYYDNIKLVYEVETRVRNLRRAADTPENEDRKKKDQPKRNDSNKNEPDQRENNYSRQENSIILARLNVENLALREPARQGGLYELREA